MEIGFRSGFDFVHKDFTYTSLIFIGIFTVGNAPDWIPFGLRKSYMLTIAVKASVLQDLKLNRKTRLV